MAEVLRLASAEDPVISRVEIARRVGELGLHYSELYEDVDEILLIAVLRGGGMFAADLMREIQHPNIVYDDMRVRTRNGVVSESPTAITDPEESLRDRHILLVEDIRDTKRTLSLITRRFASHNPASVNITAVLDKPVKHESHEVVADSIQIGFTITDAFAIGYGLDYKGRFRNLPHVTTCEFDSDGNSHPAVAA